MKWKDNIVKRHLTGSITFLHLVAYLVSQTVPGFSWRPGWPMRMVTDDVGTLFEGGRSQARIRIEFPNQILPRSPVHQWIELTLERYRPEGFAGLRNESRWAYRVAGPLQVVSHNEEKSSIKIIRWCQYVENFAEGHIGDDFIVPYGTPSEVIEALKTASYAERRGVEIPPGAITIVP